MSAIEDLRKLSPTLSGEEKCALSTIEISQHELRIGHPLPDDLRAFYLSSDGFYFPEWMWCFFSLKDVLSYQDYRHSNKAFLQIRSGETLDTSFLFIVADVLIDCPSYWIYLDANSPHYGAIFSDGDVPAWKAAPSFSDFVDRFVKDDGELYIDFESINGE